MADANATSDKEFEATDSCPICMNSLVGNCIECQADPGNAPECNIAVGKCEHAFHQHCITKWLENGRKNCPLDTNDWECVRTESSDPF